MPKLACTTGQGSDEAGAGVRGGRDELPTEFKSLGSHQVLHIVESGGVGVGRARVWYRCTIYGPGRQI